MIERHLAKLRARHSVSAEEAAAIASAIAEVRDVPKGRTVIPAGVRLDQSTLLLDGILARYKDGRNGQRQITELHVAGDFADLHSYPLKHLDHDVMTLTPCRIAQVPHDAVRELTRAYPNLGRVYWFATCLDAAIHREWTFSLGRRTALARVAALLCELLVRLQIVGLADDAGYDLPLTQSDLAECMGLTNVHVNRTLRELRLRGLARFQNGQVTIDDWAGLAQLAEFDPGYLYLGPQSE